MNELKPGLHKFIHHLDHIKKIKDGEMVGPIHVSVWPTLRCQFNCSYCCCRNTEHGDSKELDINHFKSAVDVLGKYGTKAIEFSGGGEPLLWEHFSEAVNYIYDKGIKMSLITNGMLLNKISKDVLSKLTWLRISYQSLNHAKKIDYEHLSGIRFNTSYIVPTNKIDFTEIGKLHQFVKENNIILRVAVQRPSTVEFENNVETIVSNYGEPMFFSKKEIGKPKGCYMAWVRSAIDWNGNFLPCPSIQLNGDSEGKIPDDFKLCHISNLEEWLNNNRPKNLGYTCEFCNCGKEHNDFIHDLMKGVDDVEFV